MVDIRLIKDSSNPIRLQRTQLFNFLFIAYLEGLFVSAEQVKKPTTIRYIDTNSQWVELTTSTYSEGVVGTSTPASNSTFPPRSLVVGFISMPQQFFTIVGGLIVGVG